MDGSGDRLVEFLHLTLQKVLPAPFVFPRSAFGLGHPATVVFIGQEDLDRPAHIADFIAALDIGHMIGQLARGHAGHDIGDSMHRIDQELLHRQPGKAGNGEGRSGEERHQDRHQAILSGGVRLDHGGETIGLADQRVDCRAMQLVGGGDLAERSDRRPAVAALLRRQEIFETDAPEGPRRGVGGGHQGAEAAIKVLRRPILPALFVVLLQLRQPARMFAHPLFRRIQGEIDLKVGLDQIFRRRQDIRDEVLALHDPLIDGAANPELAETEIGGAGIERAAENHDRRDNFRGQRKTNGETLHAK